MRSHPVASAALAACLALAAAGCARESPAATGETIDVEIVALGYQPAELQARVGDVIRWIQKDSFPHTVTSTVPAPDRPGGFDRAVVDYGDTVQVQLTTPGTIDYLCRPHPFMKGSIRVAP